jgi:hypothetical protein
MPPEAFIVFVLAQLAAVSQPGVVLDPGEISLIDYFHVIKD